MPRRTSGVDREYEMLRLALMEQQQNERPGRAPSGIAMNAYLGSMAPTFEQDREGDILGEMDRRFFQTREDERKRQAEIEDRKKDATVRGFETRTGRGRFTPVGTEQDGVFTPNAEPRTAPRAFNAENFGPVASHEQPPQMRQITRGPSPSAAPTGRNSNTAFTDPDMAMGMREKARLDPRVLGEEVRASADIAVAGAKGGRSSSALAKMVQDNPEILKSLSPTARTAVLQEIASAGGGIDITDPRKAARELTVEVLGGIDRLLTHPGIGAATGAYDPRAAFGGLTQDAVNFNAERDKVVAALTLPNLAAIRGPLSDKDILFVKQLATTLSNARLDEPSTRAELMRAQSFLRGKLNDGGGADSGASRGSVSGGIDVEALRSRYGY